MLPYSLMCRWQGAKHFTILHVLLVGVGVCRAERGYTEWRKAPCGPKWSGSLCAHLPLCTSITLHKPSLTCILSSKPASSHNMTHEMNGELQNIFNGGNGTHSCGVTTRSIKSKRNGYRCVPVKYPLNVSFKSVGNKTLTINTQNGQQIVNTVDPSQSSQGRPKTHRSHWHAGTRPPNINHRQRIPDVNPRPRNRQAPEQSLHGKKSYSDFDTSYRGIGYGQNANQRVKKRYLFNSPSRLGSSSGRTRFRFNEHSNDVNLHTRIANRQSSKQSFYGKKPYSGFDTSYEALGYGQNANGWVKKRGRTHQNMPAFMQPHRPMQQRFNGGSQHSAARKPYGNDQNARTKWLMKSLGM